MRLVWVACAVFVCSQVCQAQISSSTINGTVTDATGAVVAKASVTITSVATGFTPSVVTSETGAYIVSDIPPGAYEVSAEAAGFKKAVVSDVRLYVGQTATTDIRLEIGAITESVGVTSTAPLLDETNAQVGTVIEGKLLTEIPLNGRNFLQLNLLSPGVTRSKNSNTFDPYKLIQPPPVSP
jgi:Carboxypeptidase regulatory-like domain